jgi:predicted ATP-grasp superfamily ATP-dependent carboligase
MSDTTAGAPAVVLGLCAHGLATARTLYRHGIEVHALEPNSALPGSRTRCAKVHRVASIHPPELIDTLITIARQLGNDPKPVLFPINDTMVGDIARHWDQLEAHYALAWSESRDEVARLILKDNLESHSRERELNYPRSTLIEHDLDQAEGLADMAFPMLAKPSKPLGSFKTRKIEDRAELERIAKDYPDDLPILVQEWIEGGDTDLYFCALMMEKGQDLARFEGRKLRSLPPARGQTTSAEPVTNDELYDITRRFFSGTTVSGPVSLEVKRDPQGKYWIIEPTLGRTDYWVDLCIQNGVSLPVMNYQMVTGQRPSVRPRNASPTSWFDTDRDTWSFLSLVRAGKANILGKTRFTFFDLRDLGPCRLALRQRASSLLRRLSGR